LALWIVAASGCSSSGSDDVIVATPSIAGTVTAVVGGTKTLTITFNSSDTLPITDLSVTEGLSSLATGWSGPPSVDCATVTVGSGCVLTLTYAPTATAAGTLNLRFSYKSNGGTAKIGSIAIPYLAAEHDTVAATAAPTGQISSVVGTSQAVTLTFTTDDGKSATSLNVTGLTTLPAAWRSPVHSFSCATVSTGSGCVLTLSFAPTVSATGTLNLTYGYVDDAGTPKSGTVSIPYSGTSGNNSVIGTVSPSGQIVAVSGASQAVAVTFTTDDHNPATDLSVSTDLTALPTGWSALGSSFTCSNVSTGNGCQLNLTFAPVAATAGTLTLAFSYRDGGGVIKTGTLNIPYAGTEHDNAVATVTPGGQIAAIVGSSQVLSVTFTTDDGETASALSLTSDLTALPSGWTSAVGSFTCNSVSTGSGCVLPLTFTPAAPGSGTLSLNYAYVDAAGADKTGTVNIPFTSTSNNNVIGTVSPSGQIVAVTGGSQAVAVTFTTDDHNAATDLSVTTDLTALPTGWSASGSSFTCSNLSTGNGCQLNLNFAPTAAGSGTLALSYTYLDNSGAAKTGTLDIAYSAAAHDNVVGTAAPSGQINAVVSAGSQPVTVTFTTDNSTATALSLTTALNSLPAGWTSTASNFSCSTVVSSGNGCQLALTYSPGSVTSGTLTLQYAYVNNAGVASTGNVNIPYAATADDNVVGTVSPSGTLNAVTSTTQSVTVTFTTDDGNTGTDLSIANSGTGGIGSLPAGWSVSGGASSFACASINTGTGCQLALTYAPTAPATGTVTLNFSYLSNSGATKTGTVSIPYAATVVHVYVAQYGPGLSVCTGGTTLSGCASTGGLNHATGIAFYGSYAYVSQFGSSVSVCAVAGDGTLSSCTSTGSGFTDVTKLSVQGTQLYGANANNPGKVTYCAINTSDGTLSNCAVTAANTDSNGVSGVAVGPTYAYVGSSSLAPSVCTVNVDGSLTNCTTTSAGHSSDLALSDGFVYLAGGNGTVQSCPVNSDGTLGACLTNTVLSGYNTNAVAISGSTAYVGVTNYSTEHVYACSITSGVLSNCVVSDGGGSYSNIWSIAVH